MIASVARTLRLAAPVFAAMTVVALMTVVASMTVVAATPGAGQFRLTVLHTNDMHAAYEETCGGGNRCTGGFARLRAAVIAERARAAADNAPAVYLVAGDTFQGTAYYEVLRWPPAADLLGALGVDAMCLGNHEFEDGPDGLAPFLRSKNISSIPIVTTNVDTSDEPSLTNILASKVLTVGNHTVGIVGYLTPDTEWMNKAGKVKIRDEVQSLKPEVAKLKKSGVDIVIALGHSALEVDRRVAVEVEGLDAVIGGHSHSYLANGPQQDVEIPVGPYPMVEKRGERIVPVVQAYAFAKYLGKLVLTFDGEKRLVSAVGGPILLDQNVVPDVEMAKKVEYYKKLLAEKRVQEVVGETRVFLDGGCKCSETNLADLIADSFVRYNLKTFLKKKVNVTGWTDASVAITLSSGIKSSVDTLKTQGKIYTDDINNVLPYKTNLYKVTVNGSTLLKAFEHSAFLYDYKDCAIPEKNIYGGFIQVAGLHITYDMKKPTGSRVQSVFVRCSACSLPTYEPIDPGKPYRIILSKYIVNGGDGYKMIKDGITDVVELDITETDAFRTYVKEMSPIYAEVDNRIKILNRKNEQ